MSKFEPTDYLMVEQDRSDKNLIILDVHTFVGGQKRNQPVSFYANTAVWKDINPTVRSGLKYAPATGALYETIKMWPEHQVSWQSPLVKEALERAYSSRTFRQQKARFQAAWKEGHNVNLNLVQDTLLPMKEYQKMGAYLAGSLEIDDGYALFMEQRTGKTPVTIAALCHLHKMRGVRNVLIIVPPILKLNWKEEFERFAPIPCHCDVLGGNKQERLLGLFRIRGEANVKGAAIAAVVVPYDTFVSSFELLNSVEWDAIVCDESQWFKDRKTSRWKCLEVIRDKAKFRIILTGTPVGNSPVDLYTQLEFLKKGASESTSPEDFQRRATTTERLNSGIEVVTGFKDCEFLRHIIAERAFVVKRRDVMKDLPPKVYEYNSVEMGAEQARHYKELATSLFTKIQKDLEATDKNVSTINHVLTQLLRLAQITSGYIVSDGSGDDEKDIHLGKSIHYYKDNKRLDRLVEIAKELPPDRKMIIWNHWIPMIDRIFERFEAEGLGREMIVYRGGSNYQHKIYTGRNQPVNDQMKDQFNNNPRYRFLLASAKSANVGLTLPGHPIGCKERKTLCDEVVYFSYDWSYLMRAQSEDRMYETNSTHQVRVRDILIDKTIDVEVLGAIKMKKETAESLTNVKEILSNLMRMKVA